MGSRSAKSKPPRAQRTVTRCPDCGGAAPVEPGDSAYRFLWRCAACGSRGVISWATAQAPPQWLGGVQLTLFAFPSKQADETDRHAYSIKGCQPV